MHSVGKPTEFKTKPWNIAVKCNFFLERVQCVCKPSEFNKTPTNIWGLNSCGKSTQWWEPRDETTAIVRFVVDKQAKNCIALQEFAKETPGTKWETESSHDYRWRWPQPHGNSIKRFWKEINLIYYSSTYSLLWIYMCYCIHAE